MCILIRFVYSGCIDRTQLNPQFHFSEIHTIPCVDIGPTISPHHCPKRHGIDISWYESRCDDCYLAMGNPILRFNSNVDLERTEQRAPAKKILQAFLEHESRHGPGTKYHLDKTTLDFPVEFLEEVHSIYQALEDKLKWDSQKGKNHTLKEKRLIVNLRSAVQKHVVQILRDLPPYTTIRPHDIFLKMSKADQTEVFRQGIMRKLGHNGYDEFDRELLVGPCQCAFLREEVGRMVPEQIATGRIHSYESRWQAPCPVCGALFYILQFHKPDPGVTGKPWWLPILQGVSSMPLVTNDGEPAGPGRLLTHTSMKICKKGGSLVKKVTRNLTRALTGKEPKAKKHEE